MLGAGPPGPWQTLSESSIRFEPSCPRLPAQWRPMPARKNTTTKADGGQLVGYAPCLQRRRTHHALRPPRPAAPRRHIPREQVDDERGDSRVMSGKRAGKKVPEMRGDGTNPRAERRTCQLSAVAGDRKS